MINSKKRTPINWKENGKKRRKKKKKKKKGHPLLSVEIFMSILIFLQIN